MPDPDKIETTTDLPEGAQPGWKGRQDFADQIAARAAAQRDAEMLAQGFDVVNTRDPEDAAAASAAGTGKDPDADPDGEVDGDEIARQIAAADEARRAASGQPASPAGSDNVISAEDAAKLKVRLVVDGEERLVSVDEAVREAQKGGAADKRLAEATALLQRVQDQISRTGAAAPAGQPTPAPAPDSTAKVPVTMEGVKDAIDKLFTGDTEAATSGFYKILNDIAAGRGPAATPGDEKALAELAEKVQVQIDTKRAISTFQSDYQDVVNSPEAAHLADFYLAQRMQKGEPFTAALIAAGDDARKRLGMKAPAAPGSGNGKEGADRNEKRDKKAALTHIRSASRPAAASGAGDQEPLTSSEPVRSSIIQEMAGARGRAG